MRVKIDRGKKKAKDLSDQLDGLLLENIPELMDQIQKKTEEIDQCDDLHDKIS